MSAAPLIVKVGGGAGIDFEAIARDLATLPGHAIIVHGAKPRAPPWPPLSAARSAC